ncbi:Uncharacterised protein [Pseudomonas putida]|nr:hypothetical protein CSW00_26095 [Pseudomonas sp. MR 02]CAB5644154.1 Uncharacterised protein [Pseudomonas putida]CAB5690708.1 Uncharacterised protein [Pseudomonas putida]CAB5717635.1 Uncharacterised protein [Pseudomonas putida]CAB5722775.1 Uncharacterised protein [Pseudomonas putida]
MPELGLYSDIRFEDVNPIVGKPEIVPEQPIPEPRDVDREELKAHLENQDLRVDARLKSFEQTVKDAMGEIRLEMSNLGGDLKAVERDLSHLKDVKASVRNSSLAIVTAIIGSAIAIYFGVQSSNSALVSSTISGFGVGKDMATAQSQIAQQTKDTQEILRQVQEQQRKLQEALDNQAKAAPVKEQGKKR